MDPSTGEIPDSMSGTSVAATPSCVAVGTLAELDGETTVVLTDGEDSEDVGTATLLVFEGVLQTPRGLLAVCTVDLERVIETTVDAPSTRIRIQADDVAEPDRIVIFIR